MKLVSDDKRGRVPFTGDREFLIRELPDGAQIQHARITLTPVEGEHGPFVEKMVFSGNRGDWGATKTSGGNPPGFRWLEVDFHARRTLHRLRGSVDAAGTGLQVDMGGAFVRVAEDGTLWMPGDTALTIGLSATADTTLPGLTVARFRLVHAARVPDLRELSFLSHPTNLSLRLGDMAPFWTRTGELTGPETTTDFAAILQTFLAEQKANNGFYRVPVTLHSDMPARLEMRLEVDYTRKANALPAAVQEVRLPYDHASLPKTETDLVKISLPVGARAVPEGTSARVVGAFDASRVVHGPTGIVTGGVLVPVKPGLSQAQAIAVSEETPVTALDIMLAAVTSTAVVEVNLLPDSDGKPFGTSLLDRPVTLRLNRDTAGSLTWLSASLPREFLFRPDTRLWLVAQALEGEAVWGADPISPAAGGGLPALQFTDSGGLAWRRTVDRSVDAPLAAYYRLRRVPERYRVPIELLVGTGEAAQRVKLDRFQPLGRVDFALDFEEVAQAINRYLETGKDVPPREAEHLVNGDFARWMPAGFTPITNHSLPLSNAEGIALRPVKVVAAPYGPSVFVAGYAVSAEGNLASILHRLDLVCGKTQEVTLSAASIRQSSDFSAQSVPVALALDAGGSRAYVATIQWLAPTEGPGAGSTPTNQSYHLHLIDAFSLKELGIANPAMAETTSPSEGNPVQWVITAIERHPDGRRLYLAVFRSRDGIPTASEIWVVDSGILEALAEDSFQFEIADAVLARISLGGQNAPVDDFPFTLTISPDGARLYLGTGEVDSGRLLELDTFANRKLDRETAFPAPARGLALTPNGDRVLVASGAALYSVETASDNQSELRQFAENLSAMTVSGDGGTVAVSFEDTSQLQAFGLATMEPVGTIQIDGPVTALAADPGGSRIFAAVTDSESLNLLATLDIGLATPLEWALTGGRVMPVRLPAPLNTATLLGYPPGSDNPNASALSQVVAIAGGQEYRFRFYGVACESGAVAELCFLGDDCIGQHHETVPIEMERGAAGNWPPPVLHEVRVQAPAAAVQAEVRFRVPPGNAAIIDQVSLMITGEAVADGQLRELRDGLPAHWQLTPETAVLHFSAGERGTLIHNSGPQAAAISQTVALTAGKPYCGSFLGRTPAASGSNPFLALAWNDAEGKPTGASRRMEIVANASGPLLLEGTAAEGSAGVEVRLEIPSAASLEIERFSLRQVEAKDVPITFVAQSPGELILSDTRVAYEIESPAPPPVPVRGLCSPTPPDRKCGSPAPEPCGCFCPCCDGEKTMVRGQTVVTADHRPGTMGVCADCGATLFQPGGTLISNARRIELERVIRTIKMAAAEPEPGPKEAPTNADSAAAAKTGIQQKQAPAPVPAQAGETGAELVAAIRDLLEDPALQGLKGFKLKTILSWSVERLAAHLGKG